MSCDVHIAGHLLIHLPIYCGCLCTNVSQPIETVRRCIVNTLIALGQIEMKPRPNRMLLEVRANSSCEISEAIPYWPTWCWCCMHISGKGILAAIAKTCWFLRVSVCICSVRTTFPLSMSQDVNMHTSEMQCHQQDQRLDRCRFSLCNE